jgi:hypothetical protein
MSCCPISGCKSTAQEHQLFCFYHWKMVPKPLRDTITVLRNNGRPKAGFSEACQSAIDQVNEKEQRCEF